jgi:hypothetical protein
MEALWSITDALLGLSATKAEELSTLQVCLRALVVYLVLIGYVRFAKKRFLSQATGFDAILVIVIGSIASRAISGTAPFISSLAGTFVLVLVHWVISYIRDGSPSFLRMHGSVKVRFPTYLKQKFHGRKELRFPLALRATCDQVIFSTKAAGRSVGLEILTLTSDRQRRNMSRHEKNYYLVRRVLRPRSERSIRLLAQ